MGLKHTPSLALELGADSGSQSGIRNTRGGPCRGRPAQYVSAQVSRLGLLSFPPSPSTADAYIEVYTVWLQFSEFIRSFEFIPSTLRSLMLCPEVPRLPQTFGGLHAVWQYRNVGYKKFQKRITKEEYFCCNFHRILEYAKLEKALRPVRDFFHHPEAMNGGILV
ncbi:hypothetical protein GALMADRAFT_148226 [Galerina marginata CBS 339.88]|uniref:Uncharacterized protein n=1 Tax=Galerina marginata (strain CBS 339.88) TaxID=685588 RepID=A0A067S589_GALM3|nr:hypothetical protein GALMADRAFT_148226 [Galerina marginata CBS 339.88]